MIGTQWIARRYYRLPKILKKQVFKLYRHLPNRNKTIVKTIDGITYELDLSKRIPASIYYYGCFEKDTTRIIEKFVKEGMVVIDIGANMGCHALRCAKLVGDTGKVYAFEPMSPVHAQLKRGIELNNFNNIIVEKIALSNANREGKAGFHIYSTLTDEKLKCEEETISFMKLDDYVKKNNIEQIDFVKLDVDGYETKIVEGGKESLKRFKPMIIIEMGKEIQERYGDSIEKLINLLSSIGYSFYSEKTLEKYPNKVQLLLDMPKNNTINVFCEMKK